MGLHVNGGFPPDIRVAKEASALVAAGADVHVLCKKRPGQPRREERLGLKIQRIVFHEDTWRYSPGKLMSLLRHLFMGRPGRQWRDAIRAFVERTRPDVLHCHDLPALPLCCSVGHDFGIPVVADLHENWPGFTITGIEHLPRWKRWLKLKHYRRWRTLERECLSKCSRVIVVVPEAKDRIVQDYGVEPAKVVVVSNTENDATLHSSDIDLPQVFNNCRVASYIGGIGPHRGVDTSIRAAGILGRKVDCFMLAVIGASKEQVPRLKKLIAEAQAGPYVTLIERVPPDHVPGYIRASEVCLVPHNNTDHTNTTVPHKLFQYMLMERPVLVSDCPPLERIVRDADCGEVFDRGNPESMATKLHEMYSNSDSLRQWARNGRQSALGRYNWQHDADRLVQLYGSLLPQITSGTEG